MADERSKRMGELMLQAMQHNKENPDSPGLIHLNYGKSKPHKWIKNPYEYAQFVMKQESMPKQPGGFTLTRKGGKYVKTARCL